MDTRQLNTWIEISAESYRHNLGFLRQRVGAEVELSAVVKSNAYGHGLVEIAGLAASAGADSFCVHSLDEALALRASGLTHDVLIMGHVPLARLGEAVDHDFRLVLYNSESALRLAEITRDGGSRVRLHVKIETGTHRQGVDGAALEHLLEIVSQHSGLDLEGVSTHFADIEDTTDHSYARSQLARFREALSQVERAGFAPRCRHVACSAAAVLFPETHFDMVRIGISQYGFWSSKETRLSFDHGPHVDADLQPVLAWKARISQLKEVPADAYIGYGRTFQTTRPTRLAILPTGYSDGYDRLLSSVAHVLVRGRRAPVRGRICMNLTIIDVTDIPEVALEDEVVLIGRQGSREIGAEDLATLVGSISYEVVTRLAPHIPRLVV